MTKDELLNIVEDNVCGDGYGAFGRVAEIMDAFDKYLDDLKTDKENEHEQIH